MRWALRTAGLRADLCLLDAAGEVRMTLVAGKIVYER